MNIHRADVNSLANSLSRPFLMEQVAQVDHFAAYLYLCEGAVARHRHITQDELFYAHSGLLSLDTDWGQVTLSERELAVVPRGVSHVSGSITRTVVLLFQAHTDPDRKNGHGRLMVDPRHGSLPKWRVAQEAGQLKQPYLPTHVVGVDEMSLRMVWCEGETPWHAHATHDELYLVTDGSLEVGNEWGLITAGEGTLVVIPRGTTHRLVSQQHTVALSLVHGELTPEAQVGLG